MNAIGRLRAVRWLAPPAAPLPPIGVEPTRLGNGGVELRIYPGATVADRVNAARALLHGTALTVALQIEDGTPARKEMADADR